jgi:hypothetical protein
LTARPPLIGTALDPSRHGSGGRLARHRMGARYPDVTTQGCWDYGYASFLEPPPGKVVKPGWEGTAAAEQFFRDNELGAAPVGGPLLVIAGEADATVPLASIRGTVQKACRNDHGTQHASIC